MAPQSPNTLNTEPDPGRGGSDVSGSDRELVAKLRAVESSFTRMVAISSDWYWEADIHGRITSLSGRQSYMAVGRFLLEGIHADDAARGELIKTRLEARSAFRDIEFRAKDARGGSGHRWVSCSGEPIFGDGAEVLGFRGVGRDVNARVAENQGLWDMANLDGLTGLPNRLKFTSELEAAVSASDPRPFALALIDLDHFKAVNDTYGHDAGDELLISVADRLRGALRATDLIARLGGDEFAVIIRGVESGNGLNRPLEAMIDAMRAPIQVADQEVRCTLSIGVSQYPTHATQASEILKNADIAMYESKAAGRSQYTIFHSDMRKLVERKNSLARDVVEALDGGLLCLHYQPIVNVQSGRIECVEALLRWNHPSRGVLSAGQFHEVFDKSVITQRIGRFVTEKAMADAALWLSRGADFGRVSINVTSADFSIGDYPAWLASCMSKYDVPAHHVCIEVTEGMFLGSKAEKVIEGLHAIFGMGVEIAFDDYGTGFASLMHLRMPIHRIKIDRIFTRSIEFDPINQATVRAVVQLANDLGKKVTVEGVETPEQRQALLEMGCLSQQGFGIAMPMPAHEIARRFMP